jgi:hypothetical protein
MCCEDGAAHVAQHPIDDAVRHRASDRAGTDGRCHGLRVGRDRERGGWARFAPLRDAYGGDVTRPVREDPRPHQKAINANFFCHTPPVPNEVRWRDRLKPYYEELGIDPALPVPSSNRAPFDAAFCAVIEEPKPQVVSFHFGLPESPLLRRVKAAGCTIWLEQHGVDAVIAQSYEAGGHRGHSRLFLSSKN